MMIHAGSLLQADGGFLILETRDVLAEPGAWKVLVRTLRTGSLRDYALRTRAVGADRLLKPEPIDVTIKEILFDAHDSDFAELFKVLADFETSVARN
jgi:ATP-dependent Lon protease